MMALIAIFNVEAAGQDMKVQYSQFTCDFPGFRDPFLFSILEKGKGRFNNIDVFVIVAKHPSRKKYYLIHFIERTPTGNMTLTTIFYDWTAFQFKAAGFSNQVQHLRFSRKASAGVL
jgi:hypothetical protein